MTTLRPRTPCTIRRRAETHDGYGRPQISERRIQTRCAIIWLKDESQPTSVRADSSATRGRADETIYDARLLLKPDEDIRTGDLIAVALQGGAELVIEIGSVWRRPDVNGRIHHIQVEGMRWASA